MTLPRPPEERLGVGNRLPHPPTMGEAIGLELRLPTTARADGRRPYAIW